MPRRYFRIRSVRGSRANDPSCGAARTQGTRDWYDDDDDDYDGDVDDDDDDD
jgi:hypothetical protein